MATDNHNAATEMLSVVTETNQTYNTHATAETGTEYYTGTETGTDNTVTLCTTTVPESRPTITGYTAPETTTRDCR